THPLFPGHGIFVEEACQRHLAQPLDLRLRDDARGPLPRDADNRLEKMAADDDGNRREATEHIDVGGTHADLLMRFAQRRLLHRFIRPIETTAWQRDLSGVMTQR